MKVACIIIASEKRAALVRDHVLPSAVAQPFDEIVVVADYTDTSPLGVRWLVVEPLLHNTIDALVKRDVGTLATTADWLCYLSDDHAVRQIPTSYPEKPYIGVPIRFCTVGSEHIFLNSGFSDSQWRGCPSVPYCGGHAGLFPRSIVQKRPWSTMPRDAGKRGPIWDLLATQLFMGDGAGLQGPLPNFVVEDLEPQAQPWC